MVKYFKSKGYMYIYFLLTFTGSQLYSRLGVNWSHYKDPIKTKTLIDQIKEEIKSCEMNTESFSALSTLDDIFYDIADVTKEKEV